MHSPAQRENESDAEYDLKINQAWEIKYGSTRGIEAGYFYNFKECPISVIEDTVASVVRPWQPDPPAPNAFFGSHVYYVTAASQFDSQLLRLAGHIGKQSIGPRVGAVTFVVVIMGMVDLERKLATERALGTGANLVVVESFPPYGRAIGLRTGFDRVGQMARAAGYQAEHVLVHSFDSRLSMPVGFSELFARSTACGATAFAPVCMRHERDDPRNATVWVEWGYGMGGTCLSDYWDMVREGGGWREAWWYRYGAEDLDFASQLHKRLIVCVDLI
jgi:hypothetical protein